MRAARITAHGEPPEFAEVEPPRAGEGQAEVTIEVAGLNPIDLAIASGTFYSGATPLPHVPGLEAIGRKGDGELIWFDDAVAPHGTLAESALVPESSGVPVPEGVDPEMAIAFGIAGMAAWLSLEWRGRLKPGETVLVLGASGAVGQVAVQAARILGAGRVVGAARSPVGREKATALGADAVVNTNPGADGTVGDAQGGVGETAGTAGESGGGAAGLTDLFVEATGGGPDLVIDCLWGEPAAAAIGSMKRFGRLIQVGNSAGAESTLGAGLLRAFQLEIRGHRNFNAPQEVRADAFRRMCEHGTRGELKVEVESIPLERAAEAWRRQAGSPGHKLAIRP